MIVGKDHDLVTGAKRKAARHEVVGLAFLQPERQRSRRSPIRIRRDVKRLLAVEAAPTLIDCERHRDAGEAIVAVGMVHQLGQARLRHALAARRRDERRVAIDVIADVGLILADRLGAVLGEVDDVESLVTRRAAVDGLLLR